MLAHALLSLLVFNHGVIQIRFGLFELFCFCFMSNKYCLMPLNFRRYVLSEWNLINTKVKGFMKVSHVSWNVPETVFHEMLGKKSFTVYPCLKSTFFTEHLRRLLLFVVGFGLKSFWRLIKNGQMFILVKCDGYLTFN